MKKSCLLLLLVIVSVRLLAQNSQNVTATNIIKLTTLNDLSEYNGPAEIVLVADQQNGGLFYYSKEKHVIDNGVVYAAASKGCWIRSCNKSDGVRLSWFLKNNGKHNDNDEFLKAVAYPFLKVDCNASISGKTIIPEGRTLEFTGEGSITITDTLPLTVNAMVKAGDYQYIFKGDSRVIFGSTSVPFVSACWFGAMADCSGFSHASGRDNQPAIQRAIFAAQNVSELYLPPFASHLSYRISSTVTVGKKLHFFSFKVRGGGTTITFNPSDRATVLFADFKAGAALNIQGSRRSYVEDMVIRGINDRAKTIDTYDSASTTAAADNPQSFVSGGIQKNYAAIVTDADTSGKVWSADIVFQRLQIDGFYIGMSISDAGKYQGDRMRVEKSQINNCTYGISIGNAQNRACHFQDVDMNHVWCGVTNITFGNQTGSEFQITGGQWCHLYKLFHVVPSYLGQCVVSGLYTESIGCIGEIGTGSINNSSFLFTGCYFFMQDAGATAGPTIYSKFYTLTAYANVSFIGCNFWAAKHYVALFCASPAGYTGSAITLSGCSVHHCSMLHTRGNVTVDNTYLVPYSGNINYNRIITVNMEDSNRYVTGYNSTNVISGQENEEGIIGKYITTGRLIRSIPRFYVTADGAQKIKILSVRHDTLAFSYEKTLYDDFFRYVRSGDLIGTRLKYFDASADNPSLQIISVDTSAKTVLAIRFTDLIDFSKMALYTNCFFTTSLISGNVRNGSAAITQITGINQLRAGDFITFAASKKAYRIATLNQADRSLELLDAISEDISGRVTLYNEQLDNGVAGK